MLRADYDVCSLETRGVLTYPRHWSPISLPRTVSLCTPWGSYQLDFQRKNNSIVYHRKAQFHFTSLIPATDYERFKTFMSAISKADAVQLLFYTTSKR
jgi:hypothetical protein